MLPTTTLFKYKIIVEKNVCVIIMSGEMTNNSKVQMNYFLKDLLNHRSNLKSELLEYCVLNPSHYFNTLKEALIGHSEKSIYAIST